MNIVRFIFPFLFVRNWHDGHWEFSRARFILSALCFLLIMLGLVIAYELQAPVSYNAVVV